MKQSTTIKTAEDYKQFLLSLSGRLKDVWENVPLRERGTKAQKIAADLILSKTTVLNYFSGLIANPETALTILEKYNELYSGNQ